MDNFDFIKVVNLISKFVTNKHDKQGKWMAYNHEQ